MSAAVEQHVIVFNGYVHFQNEEQIRRAWQLCILNYNIDIISRISNLQSPFLANGSSKKKLIHLLEEYLKEKYECRLITGDANVIIINTVLRISQKLGKSDN